MRKIGKLLFVAIGLMALAGCATGGFSQFFSENGELSGGGGKLAVLPVDAGRFGEDAALLATQVLVQEGVNSRLFAEVIPPDRVRARLDERGLAREYAEYIRKLQILHFSDPSLSDRLAQALDAEFLLYSEVKYWGYSRLPDDRKTAKVGIIIVLLEAKTGRILGRDARYESREFRFIPPKLEDVARNLLVGMTRDMFNKQGRLTRGGN